MRFMRSLLIGGFFSIFFIFPTTAQSTSLRFITTRDLQNNNASSNLSIQNNGAQTTTVYGLYVRQYAYVLPGQGCDQETIIYPASNNVTAGAYLTPTVIGPRKTAPIGSNYLYNMLYQAIYYENIEIPSSPPGCALPGCTWGSDTTKYNWCIYIGGLAPILRSADYTSSVPPSADEASRTGNYNYNLINNYIILGPISCDDRTFTCVSVNQQIQTFS